MEKRPVLPTLKAMAVGDVETFPLSQYNSTRTSIYTGLLEERANGKNWVIKHDLPGKRVIVTRTS